MCVSIINFAHKFLFVHVPKSAGTTVTQTLSMLTCLGDVEIGGTEFAKMLERAYGPKFGVRKHSTGGELRKIVRDEVWTGLYKFAFVRILQETPARAGPGTALRTTGGGQAGGELSGDICVSSRQR